MNVPIVHVRHSGEEQSYVNKFAGKILLPKMMNLKYTKSGSVKCRRFSKRGPISVGFNYFGYILEPGSW